MRSQGDFLSPWPALGWDPSNQGWGLSRSHLSQRWGTSLQANFTGTLLEHALYPVVPGGPGPWQKAGVGARSGRPARSHRLSKAATLPSRCWARRQQHRARRWWARIRLTGCWVGVWLIGHRLQNGQRVGGQRHGAAVPCTRQDGAGMPGGGRATPSPAFPSCPHRGPSRQLGAGARPQRGEWL